MKKVLLVDDNEMNRDVLTRRLARKGFEIETSFNGQLAIEKLKTYRPDIILMDMRMPVMDGFEATKIIKEDEDLSSIPIIGLSANSLESEKDQAMSCGCDDYVTKPINLENLLEVISKHGT